MCSPKAVSFTQTGTYQCTLPIHRNTHRPDHAVGISTTLLYHAFPLK